MVHWGHRFLPHFLSSPLSSYLYYLCFPLNIKYLNNHILIQIKISCDHAFPFSYHLTLLPFIANHLKREVYTHCLCVITICLLPSHSRLASTNIIVPKLLSFSSPITLILPRQWIISQSCLFRPLCDISHFLFLMFSSCIFFFAPPNGA